jgi:hypothetical protein
VAQTSEVQQTLSIGAWAMAKRQDLEHHEQVILFKWLEQYASTHILWGNIFAIPNGGHRHFSVARKLKAEGVRKGVPDIFCAAPTERCAGLFIEMKIKPNRPSADQKDWLARLEDAGYRTEVCYSFEDAQVLIVSHMRQAIEHYNKTHEDNGTESKPI